MKEATDTINNNISSYVNYEFYYLIFIVVYMHFECMYHTLMHLICGSHLHSYTK